jgi:hypothetical protein
MQLKSDCMRYGQPIGAAVEPSGFELRSPAPGISRGESLKGANPFPIAGAS